jgi:hypothetical protein
MIIINNFFLALLVGFSLSFLWGFSEWLKLQKMKVGTSLAYGAKTPRLATFVRVSVFWLFVFVCYILWSKLGLFIVLSAVIMWYGGMWWATLIERRIYMKEHGLLILLGEELMNQKFPVEILQTMLENAIPQWWISTMPTDWQIAYYKGILERFQKIHGDKPTTTMPYYSVLKKYMLQK